MGRPTNRIQFVDPPVGPAETVPAAPSMPAAEGSVDGSLAQVLDRFVMAGPTAPLYVLSVTDANIAREVINYRGPLVLDFSSPGCGPCTTMVPILDALARRYGGQVKFCRIDDTWNSEFGRTAGISGTPTFAYFRDGKVVAAAPGAISAEQMTAQITQHLGVPRPA